MEGFCFAWCHFMQPVAAMQLVMGVLIVCISMANLHCFYTSDAFLPDGLDDTTRCGAKFHTVAAATSGYAGFDIRALAD
ncbi:hypothetical protein GUJ93_ZPchr0012g19351 [Zizania palustris]|uniref:Uncharacterized protein n=1 Tax=Zizania palustris TaxID=103762 RepID=A0A8J6BSG8_ZIZPA|nr:hypothetical protein GUJ93_ZPchr0012g19351 [Zizania palustris]